MLKIYGSMQCPDCQKIREDLDRRNIPYEYLDFGKSLKYLREFLAIREGNPVFDAARQSGAIGIPCMVREDGTVTLTWDDLL